MLYTTVVVVTMLWILAGFAKVYQLIVKPGNEMYN